MAQPSEEEHQSLAQLQEVHKVQTPLQECKKTFPAGSSSTECKPHPRPQTAQFWGKGVFLGVTANSPIFSLRIQQLAAFKPLL